MVCWDYRKQGQVLSSYPRVASTHQHIGFDIDYSSQYLMTGCDDNEAIIYNLQSGEIVSRLSGGGDQKNGVVNGVSFHPRGQPYVVLSTGTRHIKEPYSEEENSVDSGKESENESESGDETGQLLVYQIPVVEIPAILHVATVSEVNISEKSDVVSDTVVDTSIYVAVDTSVDASVDTAVDASDEGVHKKQKVEDDKEGEEVNKDDCSNRRKFTFKGKQMVVYEYGDGGVCLREENNDATDDLKFTSVQWEVLQAALSM